MLTITGKALGQRRPLFADYSIPFPPEWRDAGGLTLRNLIERVVRSEVDAFRERQAERRLLRALSREQIAQAAEKGKIEMGGSDLNQQVDVEDAIGTALQAFEDGIYLVVIDEEQQKDLDREIHLTEESRVTFLRLTMLAGG